MYYKSAGEDINSEHRSLLLNKGPDQALDTDRVDNSYARSKLLTNSHTGTHYDYHEFPYLDGQPIGFTTPDTETK